MGGDGKCVSLFRGIKLICPSEIILHVCFDNITEFETLSTDGE
jgi:hypothetical protein